MNYKLASVMTGPPSLLLHWKKLWEAFSSAKYLFYDFDATSSHNFKKKFRILFVILVPFEILSNYLNIDSSHWQIKDVERIIVKGFKEKRLVEMASTITSRTFLLKFRFLHIFFVVFITIILIVMSCN